jgi:hypothetical protein
MKVDPAQHQLLEAALDDYLDLSYVVYVLRSCTGVQSPAQVREETLRRAAPLVPGGYMEVGTLPAEGGFAAWDLDPGSALERTKREWLELGRDPNLWEICWFSLTAAGDELAREVLGADASADSSEK